MRVSTMNEREVERPCSATRMWRSASRRRTSRRRASNTTSCSRWAGASLPRAGQPRGDAETGLEDRAAAADPLRGGSTGRQHVLDAFHERGLAPWVALETTSTETIVSMVEAGLGVSIVPLMPSGAVTRDRRVEVRPIADAIRPIHSGVLLRRGEAPSMPAQRLLTFIKSRL